MTIEYEIDTDSITPQVEELLEHMPAIIRDVFVIGLPLLNNLGGDHMHIKMDVPGDQIFSVIFARGDTANDIREVLKGREGVAVSHVVSDRKADTV